LEKTLDQLKFTQLQLISIRRKWPLWLSLTAESEHQIQNPLTLWIILWSHFELIMKLQDELKNGDAKTALGIAWRFWSSKFLRRSINMAISPSGIIIWICSSIAESAQVKKNLPIWCLDGFNTLESVLFHGIKAKDKDFVSWVGHT